MAEGTDLEKAKDFFSCGSEGKSEQDILYYLGVLIKNVQIGDVLIDADLDDVNTKLAAILAKIIAAPATEAKQDTGNTSLASIVTNGTKDAGPAWTTVRGIAGVRFTSADQSGGFASVTSAPTSGQKLVITDLLISSAAAMRLDFAIESATGTIIETFYIGVNQTIQFTPRGKWKLATADKKLQVQSSVAGNISITPFYYSEA